MLGVSASSAGAVKEGCPLPADGEPYMQAARIGDLAMPRCLHQLGSPWGPEGEEDKLLTNCIGKNIHEDIAIPVLRLLVELGCPVDWDEVAVEVEEKRAGEYRTALERWLGEERQRRQGGG